MYELIIIDDEKKIAEGIANLFPWDSIGFTPQAFSDPLKALGYIGEHGADVVMTDIEMPGLDGLAICEQMERAQIPVVLISSHTNYEYFRSAIRFHVTDYLLKPLKSSDILTVFSKLKDELDASRNTVTEEPESSYYEKIMRTVEDYLQEHYRDATLEDAAVLVSLSPAYLSRLFKEQRGRGFSDCLQRTRMEKAKEMLRDIRYKAYDVAYYIGYDNPKSFSRAFKAMYGITPMEYRSGKEPEEGGD